MGTDFNYRPTNFNQYVHKLIKSGLAVVNQMCKGSWKNTCMKRLACKLSRRANTTNA